MNVTTDLKPLAAHDAPAAPFGFDEFERRGRADRRRHRRATWSIAASVSVAGLVSLLAVVTQPAGTAVQAIVTGAAEAPVQPALVDLGRFAMTSELEDHIALLDAQISAARVYAVPSEQLHQMESTRAQLSDSLQRVSYAQSLLSL